MFGREKEWNVARTVHVRVLLVAGAAEGWGEGRAGALALSASPMPSAAS